MELNWDDLVARRNVWVAYNFPSQGKACTDSLLGMVEELGELSHAWLKMKQGIRGTPAEHLANMRDAVGDISVYMMGVMSVYGTPSNSLFGAATKPRTEEAILSLAVAMGSLADAVVSDSGRWVTVDMANVVHGLTGLCNDQGWHYGEVVHETWAAVETRDWIKYPTNGRPPGHGTVQEMSSTMPSTGNPSTGKGLHGQEITNVTEG